MAGFRGLWEYRNAVRDEGNFHYSFWRKTPSQATTAGIWFDMSMSPGNPNPQYYAATPLVAQQMKRSTDGGLYHGSDHATKDKFLKRFLILSASATGLPMPFILADYLLYYPFVDTGTNDVQSMDNTLTLPRYTDGKGVQMMAVSVAANSGTSPSFVVSYVNQDGVTKTTPTCILNTSTANGSIVSNNATVGTAIATSPFIALASGDTGVRSVNSVTFTSGTDVGLFSLVLVKPLITSVLLEQTAPCEVECLTYQNNLPRIYSDAFLNLITLPNGSLSGVAFHGEIETVWN